MLTPDYIRPQWDGSNENYFYQMTRRYIPKKIILKIVFIKLK
jgi:hypothetical protein